jgi:hypothetical protein
MASKVAQVCSLRIRHELMSAVENCVNNFKDSVSKKRQSEMSTQEESYQDLVNEIENLEDEIHQEEAGMEELEREVMILEGRLVAEQEKIDYYSNCIRKQTQQNEQAKQLSKLTKHANDLRKAVMFYERRLGLSFKRLPDSCLRISFEWVNSELYDIEHCVIISIDKKNQYRGMIYLVEKCTPMIKEIHSLLEIFNTNNNFADFVMNLRKAYRSLYDE